MATTQLLTLVIGALAGASAIVPIIPSREMPYLVRQEPLASVSPDTTINLRFNLRERNLDTLVRAPSRAIPELFVCSSRKSLPLK